MPTERLHPSSSAAASTAPPRRPEGSGTARAGAAAVVALGTAAITVEGYDLIVFGVGLPALLDEESWGLNSSQGGTLGSLAYVGMLLGALLCGRLTDRYGQRRVVLGAVAWFAVFTAGCALAAAPWQFGAARLLAGIGMGGVMPAVVALTKLYAPAHRGALLTTVVLAGIPVGGSLAATVAALWLPGLGWRGLFWLGAALSAAVLLAVWLRLPDGRPATRHEARDEARDEVGHGAGQDEGAHAAPGRRVDDDAPQEPDEQPPRLLGVLTSAQSLLFTLGNFSILLAWYGLNTWLTQLMREMDYPLGSALQVTLVLNLGAVLGSFVLAGLADRRGPRLVAAGSAALAAVAVCGLALGASTTVLVLGVTALAGIGAQSALTVLNSWVASSYPLRIRGTMLGWVSATGRAGAIVAPLLGGWILQAALGPRAVFYVFAATAALAALSFGLVRSRAGERAE